MSDQEHLHRKAVNALEEHGFLFQKRCVDEITYDQKRFSLESEDYAVSVGGEETTVDFILSAPGSLGKFYLVFECKRANPDYVSWVFPKPKDPLEPTARFLGTKLFAIASGNIICLRLQTVLIDILDPNKTPIVNCGLEVSLNPGRQQRSSNATTIYSACQQALTGIGGLAVEHKKYMYHERSELPHFYVPVVITTADLYVTSYHRYEVDLRTGNLSAEKANTSPVDWVVLDWPVREPLQITAPEDSPDIKIHGPSEDYRRRFKVKSVVIVKAEKVLDLLAGMSLSGYENRF